MLPAKNNLRRQARRNLISTLSENQLRGSLVELKKLLDVLLSESELGHYQRDDMALDITKMPDPRLVILDLLINHGKDDFKPTNVSECVDDLVKEKNDWVRIYLITRRSKELIELLRSDVEDIRDRAARYLAGLGPEVIPQLEQAMYEGRPLLKHGEKQQEPFFIAAAKSLCTMEFDGDPPSLLLELATHESEKVRYLAINRLTEWDSETVIKLFDRIAKEERNYEIRKIMSRYLWEHDCPEHLEFLLEHDWRMSPRHHSPSRPQTGIQIDYLIDLISDPPSFHDEYLIENALELLSHALTTPDSEEKINKLLINLFLNGSSLDRNAYNYLKKRGVLPEVFTLFHSEDVNLKMNVLDKIEDLKCYEALTDIKMLCKDGNREVAKRAREVCKVLKK